MRRLTVLLFFCFYVFGLCKCTTQSEISSSPNSSSEEFSPGKSIHLPSNGVGTWREISLSRRSNSQKWERDGRSLGATSAVSCNLHHFCNATWILVFWLTVNYRIM